MDQLKSIGKVRETSKTNNKMSINIITRLLQNNLLFITGASPVYKSATWALVGLVLILIAVLLLVFNAFRKRKKGRENIIIIVKG